MNLGYGFEGTGVRLDELRFYQSGPARLAGPFPAWLDPTPRQPVRRNPLEPVAHPRAGQLSAAVLLLVSSQTGFNDHMRYVLPVFPLAYIGANWPWHR
jgi:hypothetical protein